MIQEYFIALEIKKVLKTKQNHDGDMSEKHRSQLKEFPVG